MVVAVVAQEGLVLMPQVQTLREPPVVLEERTRFRERVLHTRKEATEVLVAIAPAERLVRRTEAMVVVVAMVMQLQMAATEGLE